MFYYCNIVLILSKYRPIEPLFLPNRYPSRVTKLKGLYRAVLQYLTVPFLYKPCLFKEWPSISMIPDAPLLYNVVPPPILVMALLDSF